MPGKGVNLDNLQDQLNKALFRCHTVPKALPQEEQSSPPREPPSIGDYQCLKPLFRPLHRPDFRYNRLSLSLVSRIAAMFQSPLPRALLSRPRNPDYRGFPENTSSGKPLALAQLQFSLVDRTRGWFEPRANRAGLDDGGYFPMRQVEMKIQAGCMAWKNSRTSSTSTPVFTFGREH
jgi:hypothetical protein